MLNRIPWILTLAVVILSQLPALSADLDSLRAAHSLILKTVETSNITGLERRVHPRAMGFFRESQRAVTFNRSVAEFAMMDLQAFSATPYGTEYRVVGTSGIVCSVVRLAPDRSATSKPPRTVRGTYLYTNVDGRWLLASWHTSDVPLKSKR